jgi:hypothetical protein
MDKGAWGTVRGQPAGIFQHDFRSLGDRRTHLERLNPLDDGQSPVDGTGAAGVDVPQPLQTYNTSDIPILDQFPIERRPFGAMIYRDAPVGDE